MAVLCWTGRVSRADTAPPMSRSRKPPRAITAEYLDKAALFYLERYASSAENLARVLMRRVEKAARAGISDREEGRALVAALVERYRTRGLLNDQDLCRGPREKPVAPGSAARGDRAPPRRQGRRVRGDRRRPRHPRRGLARSRPVGGDHLRAAAAARPLAPQGPRGVPRQGPRGPRPRRLLLRPRRKVVAAETPDELESMLAEQATEARTTATVLPRPASAARGARRRCG